MNFNIIIIMETIIETFLISVLTFALEEIASSHVLLQLYHRSWSAIAIAYFMLMTIVIVTGVAMGHLCSHILHEHLARIFACLVFILLSIYYIRDATITYSSQSKFLFYNESVVEPLIDHSWCNDFASALWTISLAKFFSKSQITIIALSANFYAFDVLIGGIFTLFLALTFGVFIMAGLRKCVNLWILPMISGTLFLCYVVYDIYTFVIEI